MSTSKMDKIPYTVQKVRYNIEVIDTYKLDGEIKGEDNTYKL